MKYKVIKEFGSAKKGDILEEDEYGLVSFTAEENGYYRSMSLDYDTADNFVDEEYLMQIEEPDAEETVQNTLAVVNKLLDTYKSDRDSAVDMAKEGKLQPCVQLEAETVYYNLNKVLNRIKDVLENKDYEQIG